MVRALLEPTPEAVPWPDGARARPAAPGASPGRCRCCWRAPVSAASTRSTWSAPGRPRTGPEWVAGGRFLEQYLDVLDSESALDYADLVVPRRRPGGARGGPARPARALPLGAGRRVPGHRPLPGRAAARAGRRRPQPRGRRRPRPVDLRLPRGRGAGHPRLPRRLPRPPRASAPRWSRCRPPDASAPGCSRRRGGSRPRCPRPGRSRPTPSRPSASPLPVEGPLGPGRVEVHHYDTAARRGRARRRPAAPRPPRGRRAVVGDGGAGPLRTRQHPDAAAQPGRRRACRSRSGRTTPRWSPSPARSRCSTRCRPRCTSGPTTPRTRSTSTPTGPSRCCSPRSAGSTRPRSG